MINYLTSFSAQLKNIKDKNDWKECIQKYFVLVTVLYSLFLTLTVPLARYEILEKLAAFGIGARELESMETINTIASLLSLVVFILYLYVIFIFWRRAVQGKFKEQAKYLLKSIANIFISMIIALIIISAIPALAPVFVIAAIYANRKRWKIIKSNFKYILVFIPYSIVESFLGRFTGAIAVSVDQYILGMIIVLAVSLVLTYGSLWIIKKFYYSELDKGLDFGDILMKMLLVNITLVMFIVGVLSFVHSFGDSTTAIDNPDALVSSDMPVAEAASVHDVASPVNHVAPSVDTIQSHTNTMTVPSDIGTNQTSIEVNAATPHTSTESLGTLTDNNHLGSESITVHDGGMQPVVSFRLDGLGHGDILDSSNLKIGSIGTNTLGHTVFTDNSNNTLFSLDNQGNLYNSNGQVFAQTTNLGNVTTSFYNDGQFTITDGNVVYDGKTGNILSVIK